jgi:REP-associated tyrosine transposase
VQSDEYLLSCCRYIELNPVRAGMVADPADYPWSSYGERMDNATQRIGLDHDPIYAGLGQAEHVRREQYRRFVLQGAPIAETKLIRDAVQRGQLTGDNRFQNQVAKIIGKRVEARGPGRPARGSSAEK